MKTVSDYIGDFLLLNGFERVPLQSEPTWKNDKAMVILHKDEVIDEYFEVMSPEGSVYSENCKLYWLIGYLTYYGYMDKNYKIEGETCPL